MSDYTKLNLKDEVDDLAPGRMPPGIEAHFARQALGLEKSGVTYFKLAAGYHPPFGHKHGEQEEVYVVVSGSAVVKVEDEQVELRALDAIRLAPEATRALKAGPEGCEVIAFGAPKPAEGHDAEQFPGWWPEDD
jgi:mannose-6-phosphate isomerase-like protein (cupin superfamily)